MMTDTIESWTNSIPNLTVSTSDYDLDHVDDWEGITNKRETGRIGRGQSLVRKQN